MSRGFTRACKLNEAVRFKVLDPLTSARTAAAKGFHTFPDFEGISRGMSERLVHWREYGTRFHAAFVTDSGKRCRQNLCVGASLHECATAEFHVEHQPFE